MLSRLSYSLLKKLPQTTKLVARSKVLRPDYARYEFSTIHYSKPEYEVKLWELVVGFLAFNIVGFGPTLYLAAQWPKYQPKE